MESAKLTSRVPSSDGSALPAELRRALLRYATQLLGPAAGQASEVLTQARDAETERSRALTPSSASFLAEPTPTTPEESAREKQFAAVRRSALTRAQPEATVEVKTTKDKDEAPAALTQRVQRLTPKQREAVHLNFAHGFGYAAIARITGLSVHNVSFLVHSAFGNLIQTDPENSFSPANLDPLVIDYVLGEMSAAARADFDRNTRQVRGVEATITQFRALADRLTTELGSSSADLPSPAQRRRGGLRFWRRPRFYGIVTAVLILASALGWWVRGIHFGDHSLDPSSVEFNLKPDPWQPVRPSSSQPKNQAGGRPAKAGDEIVAGSAREPISPSAPVPPPADFTRREPNTRTNPLPPPGRAAPHQQSPRAARMFPPKDGVDFNQAALNPSDHARTEPIGAALPTNRPADRAVASNQAQAPAAQQSFPGSAHPKIDALPPAVPDELDQASAPQKNLGAMAGANSARPRPPATTRVAVNKFPASLDANTAGASRRLEKNAASFAKLKNTLELRAWPEPSDRHVNTLLDYFIFSPPATFPRGPMAVTIEIGPAPWDQTHLLARVVAQAAAPLDTRRPEANVVFLVDISNSMNSPQRLPLVQASARRLLLTLPPSDHVALVTYADVAQVALPPTRLAQLDKVRHAFANLRAQGPTNGGAGLTCAYRLARETFIPNGINRVILCTDGDFNMGITSESALTALVDAEARAGIELAVLAFGRGRQIDHRLEALAAKGRGLSGNANTPREAERRLTAALSGRNLPSNQTVSLCFEYNATALTAGRLVGHDEDLLPPEAHGGASALTRELAPGETLTALFEIGPNAAESPPPSLASSRADPNDQPAQLTLRVAHSETNAEGLAATHELRVPAPRSLKTFEETSPAFKFSAAVAGLGLALRERPPSPARLADIIRWIEAAAADHAADPGGYREEFLALAKEIQALANEESLE
jgi:uncharacterized protein YegL/DNA-binding CsgD family transcriptional regulator